MVLLVAKDDGILQGGGTLVIDLHCLFYSYIILSCKSFESYHPAALSLNDPVNLHIFCGRVRSEAIKYTIQINWLHSLNVIANKLKVWFAKLSPRTELMVIKSAIHLKCSGECVSLHTFVARHPGESGFYFHLSPTICSIYNASSTHIFPCGQCWWAKIAAKGRRMTAAIDSFQYNNFC